MRLRNQSRSSGRRTRCRYASMPRETARRGWCSFSCSLFRWHRRRGLRSLQLLDLPCANLLERAASGRADPSAICHGFVCSVASELLAEGRRARRGVGRPIELPQPVDEPRFLLADEIRNVDCDCAATGNESETKVGRTRIEREQAENQNQIAHGVPPVGYRTCEHFNSPVQLIFVAAAPV